MKKENKNIPTPRPEVIKNSIPTFFHINFKGGTINPQISYPITTSNRTATYLKEVKM